MAFDYDKYEANLLKQNGFNSDELTETQRDCILEPMNAPENYYCDGEISPEEAFKYWVSRLQRSGLTTTQIAKAIKLNK